jgi:hypothetical protein
MKHMKLFEEFEKPLSVARKTKFYTEDESYDGWTFDDEWNGFDVPYFEKAVADKIAKDCNGIYNEKDKTYVFPDENDEEFYKEQEIDTTDGKKVVYPIGAYAWTWTEDKIK